MDATPTNADPSVVADAATLDPRSSREMLFRMLADGKRRRLVDLAGMACGRGDDEGLHRVARDLDALRRLGMSLTRDADWVQATSFVPLDGQALARHLASRAVAGCRPWEVEVSFATGSTNTDLLRDVRTRGFAGPRARVAEIQHSGRGRLGRRWASGPGASLTASFALETGRRLSQLDGVTLVCGLAVHAVLTSSGIEARLKWPNDVLVNGGKLAGILVEAHATGTSTILVIGVGINVAPLGPRDDDAVDRSSLRRTSLQKCATAAVDRNLLAAQLALALDEHLSTFTTHGFARFAGRWNAVDAFRDRSVVLKSADAELIGLAHGVDERGALLLEVDGKRRRIIAGEVSLRLADVTQGSEAAA